MAVVLFFVFAILVVVLYASRHGEAVPRPRFETFQSGAGNLVLREAVDLPTLQAVEGLLQPRIIQLTTRDGTARYLSLSPDPSDAGRSQLLTRSDLREIDKALQAIADKAAEEAALPSGEWDRYFQMKDGLRVGYHQSGVAQTVFLDLGVSPGGPVYHFQDLAPLNRMISQALDHLEENRRAGQLAESSATAN